MSINDYTFASYEESQKLQQNLEVNLRKGVDAVKKFGQRNPEEILA